ncbi:helix-turn-helix domain-containing protein [Adhaeribacter sp. BT258]|uniref:Helix-turn-helix domain-containing protein n=1 Tax=Adhaeribacter terrigena TaxID=2793070 RepID=A0ABS1BXS7_9BACT|nr:helix-turn-helix domain-containing protein [Adhaeribacter terrigena]MBK0401880.1 helix-turn-helix domain-containing protein [Adhaeribacter terrigena]
MDKKELYTEIFENQSITKPDALTYINFRIGKAQDKPKMLEKLNNSVDKLKILCDDLKLELRLNEANPLVTIGSKQFYSTKEAGKILEVSADKIRQLIAEGLLSAKVINQRTWKLPSWSVEAYKNDLSNFLTNFEEPLEIYDILNIYDEEHQLLTSLITKEAIHRIFENKTGTKRKVLNIITEL